MAPQSSVKHLFIRGSVVRYVHLPAGAVDTALLEDATRRGNKHVLFAFSKKFADMDFAEAEAGKGAKGK